MFDIGEYVMYGAGEVCRVEEKTKRCFDGVSSNEYYKLAPVEYRNSAYYVPVKTAESGIRRLLTKEEIYSLIDGIPQTEAVWSSDKNERSERFGAILKNCDFGGMIGIIKAVHAEKEHRADIGKRLIAADERAFTAAEHMLHGEIAFVLGIKENEVPDFIKKRIAEKQDSPDKV
ncbi:MAG: hypothetical protein NC395_00970 [Prevotella sp.]|nr:hypothetical protein [Prevotella sp.]